MSSLIFSSFKSDLALGYRVKINSCERSGLPGWPSFARHHSADDTLQMELRALKFHAN